MDWTLTGKYTNDKAPTYERLYLLRIVAQAQFFDRTQEIFRRLSS